VDAALQKDPGFYEAPLMMLMAKFEEHGGTREAAIEWMKKSIATAPASQRKRLQEYLTHLEGEGEGDEAAAQPQASE
ncbi:MAG TPA: hypothetical protein VEQ85_06000, partial [Lacipirellulaceae bacterium]|nr:hypothetical protein [Lacipirellulaceae bacterium]